MALGVIAIVVSGFAVIFVAVVAILSYREQRLRLRPYVYVDSVDIHSTANSIMFKNKIMNSGLMPENNLSIDPSIAVGEMTRELGADEIRSRAILVPNQIIWFSQIGVTGPAAQSVMRGEVQLRFTITLDYEGAGRKYHYNATYLFNHARRTCIIVDGEAN